MTIAVWLAPPLSGFVFPVQIVVFERLHRWCVSARFQTHRLVPIVSPSVSPSLSNDLEFVASRAAVTLLISPERLSDYLPESRCRQQSFYCEGSLRTGSAPAPSVRFCFAARLVTHDSHSESVVLIWDPVRRCFVYPGQSRTSGFPL